MAVIYDRAVTVARRMVHTHRPKRRIQGTVCSAGCPQWPCEPFQAAYAVITRNSHSPKR
jgi:hypothetical protein